MMNNFFRKICRFIKKNIQWVPFLFQTSSTLVMGTFSFFLSSARWSPHDIKKTLKYFILPLLAAVIAWAVFWFKRRKRALSLAAEEHWPELALLFVHVRVKDGAFGGKVRSLFHALVMHLQAWIGVSWYVCDVQPVAVRRAECRRKRTLFKKV